MEMREFRPINWMQGMNVSSAHFIATENCISEKIYRGVSLSQEVFSFGMLPAVKSGKELNLFLVGREAHTKVVLKSYYGVVRGGVVISLDEQEGVVECACGLLEEGTAEAWNVVLTVFPYDRNPCGVPDMQEQPPRYPFVESSYQLSLMERGRSLSDDYGEYSVVVGLLRKKDDVFVLDANYIPPSVNLDSNEALQTLRSRFSSYLSTIRTSVSVVLGKALEQSNKSALVRNIILVCEELLKVLASFYFDWNNISRYLSPYRSVEMLNRVPSSFLTALDFISKSEREELLTYFKDWNGIAPSSFEQMLADSVTQTYNHNRIGESFYLLEVVFKNVQELFVSLSHLEQIGGKRRDDMVIYFSGKQSEPTNGRESWFTTKR